MTFYKILLIPTNIDTDPSVYGILWYLTTMIVVETVMFPLIVKHKKNFIYIISPIIVILLIIAACIYFMDNITSFFSTTILPMIKNETKETKLNFGIPIMAQGKQI